MSLEDTNVREDNIVDLNLDGVKKTQFRINGDNSKILELNIADMGIMSRLDEVYDDLRQMAKEATSTEVHDTDEETIREVSKQIMELDAKMREKMDYLFQAPVSKVCASSGTMFDPVEGKFRFEYIIEHLSNLYANNFKKEFDAMEKNISKRTAKYTTQDHLPSAKKRSRKN